MPKGIRIEDNFENPVDPRGSKEFKATRFWLPRGGKAEVIFVSSRSCVFSEHNFPLRDGSHFGYFLTCLLPEFEKCGGCSTQYKAQKKRALTIIDLTPFEITTRSGEKKKIHYSKKLFVTSNDAKIKQLVDKFKERYSNKPFESVKVTIRRSEADKAPNVGDDFELTNVKDGDSPIADLMKLPEKFRTIFDYVKCFARDEGAMREAVARLTGKAEPEETPLSEDEIPY